MHCTDVPDWVTTSAVQAIHFWGVVTVLILGSMVTSWHPALTLAEGRTGTLSVVQPGPAERQTDRPSEL